MHHPESTDICDLSSRLFPAKFRKAAFIFTSIAFLLNNLYVASWILADASLLILFHLEFSRFIMGLHVLSGSVALNTLSGGAICSVGFAAVMVAVMFILSLVRELNQVATLGFFAAFTMGIAFVLCLACELFLEA